jgi:hypothetical protein
LSVKFRNHPAGLGTAADVVRMRHDVYVKKRFEDVNGYQYSVEDIE